MTIAPPALLAAVRSFDDRLLAVLESFSAHEDVERLQGDYGAARREESDRAGIRPVLLDAAWEHYARLPEDSRVRVNEIEIPR